MRYDPSKIGEWDYRSRRRRERDELVKHGNELELEHAAMFDEMSKPSKKDPDVCPDCGYTGWKGRRCYGRGRRYMQ